MILINKKRIIFISLIIFSSIFYSALFQDTYLKTELVSSTPISNHIIILDAGHGRPDGGAISNDKTVIESDINLNVVLKLQNLLETSGCKTILTRSDENGIYESTAETIRQQKISDMKNRVEIANNSDAQLFVSIHMNKLEDSQYYGWQTFYKNKDETSKKVAQNIQSSLNNFMKRENKREIKSISKIYLTEHVEIPLVLIECGFLSNQEETDLLKTEKYQDKLAWSIYIGIMEYFNNL